MSGEGGGLGAEPGRALKFRQRSGGRLEGRLEKQQAARPKDHQEPWQPRGTAVLEEAVWTVGAGSLVKGTGRGAVSQRRWRLSLCLTGRRILPAEVGAGEGVTGLPVGAGWGASQGAGGEGAWPPWGGREVPAGLVGWAALRGAEPFGGAVGFQQRAGRIQAVVSVQ